MISCIKNWSQGIIVAVIIATILEMLLPENKNKKYITSVIGVFILFSIISPIVSKVTGKTINLEDYIEQKNITSTNYTMNNVALLEKDTNIENLYIKTLKQDITNTVKLKGYIIDYIDIKIETNSEKNYGEILSINIEISLPRDNSISNVEQIEIGTSKVKDEKKYNVSEGQLNIIRELLMETYGISKDKIHINT